MVSDGEAAALAEAAGNIEAFTRLLAAMRPKLHRYCARMTGSVIDGEDVVQEAMLKALQAFPRETAIANIEAWGFRIAHNAALDYLRRKGREPSRPSDDVAEELADPGARTDHRLATSAALYTFMRLPPSQRAAVILMDVLGYSLEEIGTVLAASVASVKASLHRGRARLRGIAAEAEPPPSERLDAEELAQLSLYVDRFNARDFDGLRVLLAEDVRLDLAGHQQLSGRRQVGSYFGRYDERDDWRFSPGLVEGRPAALCHDATGAMAYFVLIDWRDTEISRIRDFRYARYVVADASIEAGG